MRFRLLDLSPGRFKFFQFFPVIFRNPLNILVAVQKIRHTLGSEKDLQKHIVPLLIHEFNPLFHGGILSSLHLFCIGQLCLSLLYLCILIFNPLLQLRQIIADLRQVCIQRIELPLQAFRRLVQLAQFILFLINFVFGLLFFFLLLINLFLQILDLVGTGRHRKNTSQKNCRRHCGNTFFSSFQAIHPPLFLILYIPACRSCVYGFPLSRIPYPKKYPRFPAPDSSP